jgi:hypothetical protein
LAINQVSGIEENVPLTISQEEAVMIRNRLEVMEKTERHLNSVVEIKREVPVHPRRENLVEALGNQVPKDHQEKDN